MYEQHLKQLIYTQLIPEIAPRVLDPHLAVEQIAPYWKTQKVLKGQELESPGNYENGKAWFSISAMVHGYYYDVENETKIGTRIWKKRELIFDSACMTDRVPRTDYLEALEPGEMLSISYEALREMTLKLPEVEQYIKAQKSKSELYYRKHGLLMAKPALQKVREFEEEHPLFAKIASNSIKAIHVGLARQSYELQLKRLRKG